MSGFKTTWRRYYPYHHPVSYMMRMDGAKHWLRFHSLPGRKRYADTDQECQVLLGRQNELATEVLGADTMCWLVQTCWVTPKGSIDYANELDPFRACREFNLAFAWRFKADHFKAPDEDEVELFWDVHAGLHQWKSGAFDELLLAIANEQAGHTLWLAPLTGSVFAPYDGGVDLFLPSASTAEQLASAHHDWLPFLPYGH
jgi:hypothetical protein